MTDKELENFLEENEIGVGDILEVNYFRMFSEVITGSVVLKTLQFGGRTINTQVGELILPEEKLYLIIHNNRYGALGMSSQFIKNIILLERRGLTVSSYYKLILDQSIKSGDLISYVATDSSIQQVIMKDPQLDIDEDGDEFFKILNNDGVFNCYLQGLTSLKKV
jgi:hypothetical protein